MPPPRFTTGDLKERDVNFCYGSRDGQLWPILDAIFNLDLKFETTQYAIDQRKDFLLRENIGICDIVASAMREKIDASDVGMQDVEFRDVVSVLRKFPKIDTLLFTGGNSKNGPEYFFRRHLKLYNLKLELVDNKVPRIHQFKLPDSNRVIKTVSLTAPSGAANRAVGSLLAYKEMKQKFPKKNTIDFRIEQYRPFFLV
ncbi:hypothetical protein ULMS_27760 [Patiriisocius marinistellae]|uniref:DNA glycosylase n=1 Tax=Patiriisocius marinistellae TaxID=2494560 RepID=A0A5J4G0L4_9FLAO|nr:hypothetical protein ULMS_27760 [Patiriisocius marinistellae]